MLDKGLGMFKLLEIARLQILGTSPCGLYNTEAESKEKHGVLDPIPESTLTHLPCDNPIPESTITLCQSRLYPPSQRLWIWPLYRCQTAHTV
jgi:hypothetical protein